MPGLTTKLFSRIQEIPEKDWAGIFPKELENYYFFKALDESDFRKIRFYYAMVYESDIPVGAATFFLMDFQLDMAVRGWLKCLTKAVKKVFPGILGIKIIFCGLPMGHGRIGIAGQRAVVLPPVAKATGQKKGVLEAVVECMEKLAKQEKALVIAFKDFDASYGGLLQGLQSLGFVRIASLPTTVMNINFDNFDGYLKTLSRSSREGFKRKLKKIAQGPKFDLEITSQVNAQLSCQMHELYMQTVSNSEVEFEELPSDFFANISRNTAERARFFFWRLNGKLIAFAYCLILDAYFIDYYLGFDYSVAHKYNLYFVRFRDLISWCIDNKMKVYEMGQSSYEVKRRLGFEFVPLNAYCKPASRLILPLFKFYNKFLVFEKFDPVFKEMNKR